MRIFTHHPLQYIHCENDKKSAKNCAAVEERVHYAFDTPQALRNRVKVLHM